MTTPEMLRDRLAALADQAENYADADAVLRRLADRRRRLAAVAAAVTAVLVISAGAVWIWGRPGSPQLPTGAVSPSALAPAVPYPATVDPPAKTAPALPTDRGVGAASLIYLPCGTCHPNLVMPDGRQYRLAASLDDLGLSPDGRWLRTGNQVRDLTGTATRPIGYPLTNWSPDGRWLLTRTSLTNLRAGTSTVVAAPALAVLAGGDLLVLDGTAGHKRIPLRVQDQSGQVLRRFVLDLAPVLHGAEDVFGYTNLVGGVVLPPVEVGDGLAWLAIHNTNSTSVIVWSLRDGSLVRRIDLTHPNTPYEDWTVLGFDGNGILARFQALGASPSTGPSPGQRQFLSLIDPRTGARKQLCSLPANFASTVLTRGARYPS